MFTITVGWWIIPLLITVISVVLALRSEESSSSNVMSAAFSGIGTLIALLFALVLSLVSWVVYLLLT